MRVNVSRGDADGDYVFEERLEDGRLALCPDTSVAAIFRRVGGRPMTPEEFERHFGHLPTDGEG